MKAWVVARHGGNEVLELRDANAPRSPSSSECRVQIIAVGLNHLDLWVRKGVEGHRFPLPLVLGCDAVGRRVDTGQRVLIVPGSGCGSCAACQRGEEPLCARYGIRGETQDGNLISEVVVPQSQLISLPDTLSDEAAASLAIPYLTAYTMLIRNAKLRAGEWILIHAAGSGVSIAALQLARWIGARTIVTSTSREKLERAKALGAEHVFLNTDPEFRSQLSALFKKNGIRGVRVAVDHVGEATFESSLRALERGGCVVTCGATSGSSVTLDLKLIFFKSLSIFGTTMGSRADLEQIVNLAARGIITPVIDQVFDFEEVPQAFERLESRRGFGKVVVRCSS